jgi:hypothetical protein
MSTKNSKDKIVRAATKNLKRELTLLPLFGLIYFTVCGGSFGAEPMVGWSGPGLAILLFFVTPILFSIPNMLMVREMQSMMPIEGGYYHWLKKAFGPFVGFMGGWMNWVVAWVDVSIYPVLAAYYLGYFYLKHLVVVLGSSDPHLGCELLECARCTHLRFNNQLARCSHVGSVSYHVNSGYRLLDKKWCHNFSTILAWRSGGKLFQPDGCTQYWHLCGDVEFYGVGATYRRRR